MELMKEDYKDLPPHLQKLVREIEKKQKEWKAAGVKTFVYNPETGKADIEVKEGVEMDEGLSLQATMALDDAGIKNKWKKGKLYVAKKDIKKAEKALGKSFKKGGEPDLYYENFNLIFGVSKKRKRKILKK